MLFVRQSEIIIIFISPVKLFKQFPTGGHSLRGRRSLNMWAVNRGVPNALLALFCLLTVTVTVLCQNLNVIPELFRSYVNEFPELQTLNILGNVSEVLFSNAKYEASVKLGKYVYDNSYDFIIIGSSPAGCVLANRLSANPEWTVLLIEAGPPESPIQSIPLVTSFTASSKYVRKYYFERNPGACLSKWEFGNIWIQSK